MQSLRTFGLSVMGLAMVSWGALAFTPVLRTGGGHLPHLRGASQAKSAGLSYMGGTATTVLATSLLTLGTLVARSKTARAAVLEKDSAGRFRFATSAGSAAAVSGSTELVFAEQPGVSQPWGFYDPLNFCKSGLMTFPNQDDPTGFQHLRNAELKHGRFAMMAATGSLFACYVKFPGFENVPSGFAALNTAKGAEGFALLVALIAAHEIATWSLDEEPASYAGLRDSTPELVTKELNNGRLAMFAFAGQISAEMLTGQDPLQQFLAWAYSYPKFV
ncbi:FCPE [Symbiodinium necroappetens]|uniref:FCPE protein n=1 Tax=Symbiodinium necroappetens TaxID=1628268 RepID=A0A812MAY8_9DINO|nr:FCPE [Symbiodinium necroappetens]|mmetsp:Transcript_49015/g.116655  ORF Transcript_49015/g.116655 Transcript_49015/m.116655 type:complete len:275 (-) Transcript_49015:259-1083(-)